jgi:Cof subfamily protein (haloacid dehalogenase superfamily)
MDIKLVVADVDGTLVNSHHELTDYTRETLLTLQQGGIKFTVATGKVLPSISDLVDTLGLDQPLILANGALIQKADGTVLFETPLPPPHFPALLDFVKASGLDYALFMRDQVFVPHQTHNTALVVDYHDPEPITIGQMDLAGKTFCKLVVLERNDAGQLDHLGNMLNETFRGVLKAHRSVPGMLEVFNAQTSKAVAIQKVAEQLGLDIQQVMAIGDSYNDVDMFKIAGIAVAMGNAHEDVKQQAHTTIGTNDEDGLAQYISKFFS